GVSGCPDGSRPASAAANAAAELAYTIGVARPVRTAAANIDTVPTTFTCAPRIGSARQNGTQRRKVDDVRRLQLEERLDLRGQRDVRAEEADRGALVLIEERRDAVVVGRRVCGDDVD